LGGAAAAEGQAAVNALYMEGSSCDFDRARSRPAKIVSPTQLFRFPSFILRPTTV
jgi:hypothetical protein